MKKKMRIMSREMVPVILSKKFKPIRHSVLGVPVVTHLELDHDLRTPGSGYKASSVRTGFSMTPKPSSTRQLALKQASNGIKLHGGRRNIELIEGLVLAGLPGEMILKVSDHLKARGATAKGVCGKERKMSKANTATPGPWVWQSFDGGKSLFLGTPNHGRLVVMDYVPMTRNASARFARRTGTEGGLMVPATLSNVNDFPDARLIAASPDLLEACRMAYEDLEQYEDIDLPSGYAVKATVEALREAIAKAVQS